jgi:DNA-dependent RNA polymerase auxiliary subunit epsilon
LEIYQLCETMTIKNAQFDINNHLSEIEKKMPQAEKIIEFINSLSDQELKYSGVTDRFDVVLNVRNVIERGSCSKHWLKRLKKFIR